MKDFLPYLTNYSPNKMNNIYERIKSLGADYKPRTEHLNKDGFAIFVNDLIFEESPYLLQHAHNPVNWQAWSVKAFELAKKENKSIFLSIGYATCHWCHVMEHESFEDIAIAKFINEHFIAIKVDRERRTAIDAYYMTGVQMMTGHGGWPMSNFLTPEAKPFFGGAYYNPTQFMTLLKRVAEVWEKQETDLRKQASKMDVAINQYLSQSAAAKKIDDKVFNNTNVLLQGMFDELQGGFSSAPKFPQEPWLLYLLNQDAKQINKALTFTLNTMQQGGIYDQIGGGFHRYSVDNEWLAPHFEKMLYNQSQLGEVYTLAALNFNNPEFKRTACAIFDYVLAEMLSPQGVFYSAGDADSQGVEGLFFTWSIDELQRVLNSEEFTWLQNIYHFSKQGNFEHRNILNLNEPLSMTAQKLKLPYSEFIEKLDTLNQKLYRHRAKRVTPLIDDKIITSWNGQMIYALALSATQFEKPEYLNKAVAAMDFILDTHTNKQGYLVRNSLNGKASVINAELEDYAWVITALIQLYDVSEDDKWLKRSEKLIQQTQLLFVDEKSGGYFDNIPEKNIPNNSRIKKSEDGATVSANGQLLIALARYIRRTGDLTVDEHFTQALAAFSGKIVDNPVNHSSMLRAKNIYDKGEHSNLAYVSHGKVKITTQHDGDNSVLAFKVKPNWHINANKINSNESLIPLSISSDDKIVFNYPKAKTTQVEFNQSEISTFEGHFKVTAKIPKDTKFPLNLSIKLQTCSDKICLPPTTIKMKVFQ